VIKVNVRFGSKAEVNPSPVLSKKFPVLLHREFHGKPLVSSDKSWHRATPPYLKKTNEGQNFELNRLKLGVLPGV
jgi:hypothetical protein